VKDYLPSNVDLNEVMDNWVNKPGYPVITVTWSKTQPDSVNITQERFFLVKPMKEDNTQWYVPINYVTEESPEKVMPTDKKSYWMIPGTYTVLNNLNNTKWILFNKDQTGTYTLIIYCIIYIHCNVNILLLFHYLTYLFFPLIFYVIKCVLYITM